MAENADIMTAVGYFKSRPNAEKYTARLIAAGIQATIRDLDRGYSAISVPFSKIAEAREVRDAMSFGPVQTVEPETEPADVQ
jgi:hypothetical protein